MVFPVEPYIVCYKFAIEVQVNEVGALGHDMPVPACLRALRKQRLHAEDRGACVETHVQMAHGVLRRDPEADDDDESALRHHILIAGCRHGMPAGGIATNTLDKEMSIAHESF